MWTRLFGAMPSEPNQSSMGLACKVVIGKSPSAEHVPRQNCKNAVVTPWRYLEYGAGIVDSPATQCAVNISVSTLYGRVIPAIGGSIPSPVQVMENRVDLSAQQLGRDGHR